MKKLYFLFLALFSFTFFPCDESKEEEQNPNPQPTEKPWRNTLLNEDIRALAVNGSTVMAGTFNYGLYRSIDNGETWALANTGLSSGATSSGVYSIRFANGKVYVGTYDGVFVSVDNGASWSPFGLNNNRGFSVNDIEFVNGTIFVATQSGGVWKSADNGSTWSVAGTGLNEGIIETLAAKGSTIYAGTYSGIYVSHDAGATWTKSTNGIFSPWIANVEVAGSNVFASVTNVGNGSEPGIYMSTDTGGSWVKIDSGDEGYWAYDLEADNTHLYVATHGVCKVQHDGQNWTPIASSNDIGAMSEVAVGDSNIFAGYFTQQSGVWKRVK